jgi:hypothetical protein
MGLLEYPAKRIDPGTRTNKETIEARKSLVGLEDHSGAAVSAGTAVLFQLQKFGEVDLLTGVGWF